MKSSLQIFAVFAVFLSFFQLAFSAPLALTARADPITLDEYKKFLTDKFPDTGKYILYSGKAASQVEAFIQRNSGYNFFDTFWNTDVFTDYFGADRADTYDAELQSRAIAEVGTDQIYIFGAIQYQKPEASQSFFVNYEEPYIAAGTRLHMVKDAVRVDQVAATENGSGQFTYNDGYDSSYDNAQGAFGDCSTTLDEPTCDNPHEGG